MIRSILLLLLLIEVLPAHARGLNGADTAELPCRQKAEKLLDETLSFMEKNYYRRSQVSWPVLRADAKARLREAASCDDAYGCISWCFRQLNEPHTFIMPPEKAAVYSGSETTES